MAFREGDEEKALQRAATASALPLDPGDQTPDVPTGAANATPVAPVIPAPPAGSYPVPPVPSDLKGKARFDFLMSRAPSILFDGPNAYIQFLRSLPDDPNDPEYQRLIDEVKRTGGTGPDAKLRGKGLDVFGDTPLGKMVNQTTKGGKLTQTGVAPGSPGAPGSPEYVDQQNAALGAGTTEGEGNLDIKKNQGWDTERIRAWQQPTFVGGPTSSDSGLDVPDDPFVARYNEEHGIQLDPQTGKQALGSGKYVYMGTETDPGGNGATRDVYMYLPDAEAEYARLPPDLLSRYQEGLGLPVSGRPDPTLAKWWDYAVAIAARSAMTGQKVSVRELFDIYVQGEIGKRNAAGGGGGGGGSGLSEDNPEDQVAVDYYRGMMAVLGDISGLA